MLLSKTKLYVILAILVAVIGFLIYNGFQSRAERDAALKAGEIEKEEVIRVRDSARIARDERLIKFETDLDSLLEVNKRIEYVPYEKYLYLDRNVYDAINILDSTKYEQ